jgi:hypothetical protein
MRGALLALIALPGMHAGDLRADAWDKLYGQWVGHGEVNGMRAEVVFQFFNTLDGRGRQLRFENTMTAKDGSHSYFRADAYYMCDDRARNCRGHWYDSRGVVLPLTVATRDDRIIVNWGGEATERGRTTYLSTPDCCLKVIDEVRTKDGTWKVFGRTTSRPSDGGASYEFDTAACSASPTLPSSLNDKKH